MQISCTVRANLILALTVTGSGLQYHRIASRSTVSKPTYLLVEIVTDRPLIPFATATNRI